MNIQPLDRRSAVPLYYQIQQRLLDQIRAGAIKPGQSLPSEETIAQQFRVSRMTGRHALKSLCDAGVTYTLRGKGTFVSSMKLEIDLRQVTSFTEEMQTRGLKPGSAVVSFEIARPDEEAARALHLSPRDKVVSLRRIRLANSAPMGVEWARLPQRLCPDLIETFDPRTSLYDTLARRYGVHLAIADEVVEAGLMTAGDARLLEAPKGSPVFLFTRTSYLQSGEAVEFVKSVYRADRYKIANRLVRRNRDMR